VIKITRELSVNTVVNGYSLSAIDATTDRHRMMNLNIKNDKAVEKIKVMVWVLTIALLTKLHGQICD